MLTLYPVGRRQFPDGTSFSVASMRKANADRLRTIDRHSPNLVFDRPRY